MMIFSSWAQTYTTTAGTVSFFSGTPVEDIEAVNNKVGCLLNAKTGGIAIAMFIKDFRFESSVMRQHFNESYMESERYPKAVFNGNLANMQQMDLSKEGVYAVVATGKLTIHGITKDVTLPGNILVGKEGITIQAKFNVKTADYNIKIPTIVYAKIAEVIEVTVNCKLATK